MQKSNNVIGIVIALIIGVALGYLFSGKINVTSQDAAALKAGYSCQNGQVYIGNGCVTPTSMDGKSVQSPNVSPYEALSKSPIQVQWVLIPSLQPTSTPPSVNRYFCRDSDNPRGYLWPTPIGDHCVYVPSL